MILISTNVPFASQDAFHWLQRLAVRVVPFKESFVAILLWVLGLAWLTTGILAIGGYDYFLFSYRPPHMSDVLQGVVLVPGVLALVISAVIRLTRRDERSDLQA